MLISQRKTLPDKDTKVYKLLEKADLGTYDNDESKGFKMPWQQ